MTDYGKIVFEGKEIKLTEEATAIEWSKSYMTTKYKCKGRDVEGNMYYVYWHTTQEWDDACELYDLNMNYDDADDMDEETRSRYDELCKSVSVDPTDESNACDWDDPYKIQLVVD